MNDKQTLIAMLDRAGIAYEDDGQEVTIPEVPYLDDNEKYIYDDEGRIAQGPNRGYSGFLSRAFFDADGNLIAWGAWE